MISLRDYAKHRGTSVVAVSRAVKAGRLRVSVTRNERGQPKIADVALADAEWTRNTDLSRAPGYVKARGDQVVQTSARASVSAGPAVEVGLDGQADVEAGPGAAGGELTLSQASAEEKRWKAKIAEQEYRKRAGELIDAREVVDRVTHLFTVCRTQLLALPSKAKQVIPDLSHEHVRLLDDLVRQSLEELSVSRVIAGANTGTNGATAA
jgi:hypothetical protein